MSGTIQPSTAAGTAAAASPRTGISADFNSFLRMLTTQLQNQDPTKAMDAQQMTQQLVQFSSVEQQLAMNQNLDRLVSLQQTSQVVAAAPLMGRVVEPGKMANWIAPPPVGINRQPVDFEYVRFN